MFLFGHTAHLRIRPEPVRPNLHPKRDTPHPIEALVRRVNYHPRSGWPDVPAGGRGLRGRGSRERAGLPTGRRVSVVARERWDPTANNQKHFCGGWMPSNPRSIPSRFGPI